MADLAPLCSKAADPLLEVHDGRPQLHFHLLPEPVLVQPEACEIALVPVLGSLERRCKRILSGLQKKIPKEGRSSPVIRFFQDLSFVNGRERKHVIGD